MDLWVHRCGKEAAGLRSMFQVTLVRQRPCMIDREGVTRNATCQRAEPLFHSPRPRALVTPALGVNITASPCLPARGLFDDHFTLTPPLVWPAITLLVLGLGANMPRLGAALAGLPDPGRSVFGYLHAVGMPGFAAAAVWEVTKGWRDDLMKPRRAARRCVKLGIGAYSAMR